MRQISIEEAQVQFLGLIEAALNGEEIIITQEDQPIIKFVTIDSPKPQRQRGSAKGLITIADDFDEPLQDFAEYME
jgi:antitoxin (DNA-binding transcriptional repressor) of toxin-antitoxin stability system